MTVMGKAGLRMQAPRSDSWRHELVLLYELNPSLRVLQPIYDQEVIGANREDSSIRRPYTGCHLQWSDFVGGHDSEGVLCIS